MDLIEASVIIDRGASRAEVEGVAQAFRAVGVEPTVRTGYGQKSEVPPWMVMAFMPVTAFLTALVAEAGKDAYKKIKELIKGLEASRATSKQPPREHYREGHGDEGSDSRPARLARRGVPSAIRSAH